MVAGSWMMILVTLAAIDARRGHADCFLQPFAIGMSIHIALLFMVNTFGISIYSRKQAGILQNT